MQKRTTSADVARAAGVSRATVSYVLNDTARQSIPERTRARVRAAAAELNYTPNPAARALRSGRSTVILFVIRHTPYGSNVGLGTLRLSERALERGFTLLVWQSVPGEPLSWPLTHVQPRVVASFYPLPQESMDTLALNNIPFACTSGTTMMSAREGEAATVQVRRLVETGHRRLAHVSAAGANSATWAKPRHEAFLAACADHGLPEPRATSVELPPLGTPDDITDTLRAWCSGADPVTAVAAYNDAVAALVMASARELGLRIPEDLAVIGVDDEAYAALLEPPLTTVRIPMDERADELFDTAMRVIGEEPGPEATTTVRLVPRASA